jgi:Tol biopolymer transport system component
MNKIALLCGIILMSIVGSAAAQSAGMLAYIFISGPSSINFGVFTMETNGENKFRLPEISTRFPNINEDFNMSWSPDGSRMALSLRDPITLKLDIFLVNRDGTNPINLTNDGGVNKNPSWSPDGHQIVFESFRNGRVDIYTINIDGSGLTQLTTEPVRDRSPVWSPDGRRIAFISARDGNDELYVMNADGSNPVRLTDSPGDENFPDWSPDGTQIAYGIDQRIISVIDADGSSLTHLTDDADWRESPAWSPDGNRIAFSSDGGDPGIDIYIMSADGSNPINVTNSGQALSRFPSWAPVGGLSSTLIEATSWGQIKAARR